MPQILVEVCVDSVVSALAAVRGGADRLEVCGNLGLGGGTTPSIGLVRSIRKTCPDVPLMIMVRPRTGDFCYSDAELDVMVEDIDAFRTTGIAGVVFGVLTSEGAIDLPRTQQLAKTATGLQVCFHRAFDMIREPAEGLRQISKITEITRILTSGQAPSAPLALDRLASYHDIATSTSLNQGRSSPITILPGSGIGPRTISTVLAALLPHGLKEVHLSGGRWENGSMTYRPEGMGMGVGGPGEWGIWKTDEETVRVIREAVDRV